MSERLKKLHSRAIAIPGGLVIDGRKLPGGIAGVSVYTGHHRNTLLNWFSGRTTPTTNDIDSLVQALAALEIKAQKKAEEEKAFLESVLA